MTSLSPTFLINGPNTQNLSSNYSDYLINCAGGTVNLTLPQAKLNGQQLTITRNDSGVTGGSTGTLPTHLLLISPFGSDSINRMNGSVIQPNNTSQRFFTKDGDWFQPLKAENPPTAINSVPLWGDSGGVQLRQQPTTVLGTFSGPVTANGGTDLTFSISRANVAFGHGSIFGGVAGGSATTGIRNTAFGGSALAENDTGNNNSAFGTAALKRTKGSTGIENSAFGGQALFDNTTGARNSAFGYLTLLNNITGDSNSGFGQGSLQFVLTGSRNTALGAGASVQFGSGGFSDCIILGADAIATLTDLLVIGSDAWAALPGNVGVTGPTGATGSNGSLRIKIGPTIHHLALYP